MSTKAVRLATVALIAIALAGCTKTEYDFNALGFASKDDMEAAFAKGYHTKKKLDEMVKSSATNQTSAASSKSFLQTLLENTWTLQKGMPCTLNGGAYVVYDKDYGKYFVTAGQSQKPPKPPKVKFTEVDAATVTITVEIFGTEFVEQKLNEKNVVGITQEITIRKLDNRRIEETNIVTGLTDAIFQGKKEYKTEPPQVSINELCTPESATEQSAPALPIPTAASATPPVVGTVGSPPISAPPPPAPAAEVATAPCTTVKACADAMLAAAKREALPSAMESALRIDGMTKPQRGDRKLARKLNAEGLEALKQRKLADAAATLTKALQADPADEEIIANLIYTYSEDGNFTKSEQLAYDGLLLNPRRANIWLPIAIAKQKQNKMNEALQAMWLAWQFSGDKQKMLTLLDKRIAEETDGGLKSMYVNAKAWAVDGKKPSF